jgi:hypothetical protein
MLNPANGGTSNKTCAEFISVSRSYGTLKRVQGDKNRLRHSLEKRRNFTVCTRV